MLTGAELLETCRRFDFELKDGVVHVKGYGSGSNSILIKANELGTSDQEYPMSKQGKVGI